MWLQDDYLTWLKAELCRDDAADVVSLAMSGVVVPGARAVLKGVVEKSAEEFGGPEFAVSNEYGLPSLVEAIRSAYGVVDQHVVLTAGAFGGVRLALELFVAGRTGAEVVAETPIYQPIAKLAVRLGANVTPVARGDGFVDRVVERLGPKTACVVLSNPHNPLGDCLDESQLERLASEIEQRTEDGVLLVDEVYGDAGPLVSRTAASFSDRIVAVNSLTKVYGQPELRCGWLIASRRRFPDLLEHCSAIQGVGSKILERQSFHVFEQLVPLREEIDAHLRGNRAVVGAWLGGMVSAGLLNGEAPQHGCVVFPAFTAAVDSLTLVERLRRHARVLVTPGRFFDADSDDRIRIGFGGPTGTLTEGLDRLGEGLKAIAHSAA